jgi:solute carrier family 27 fatty acid transporter 1/4
MFAVNMEGKVGAVGFKSLILPSVLPVILIKVDEETGEPIRDKDGLCIECEPGPSSGLLTFFYLFCLTFPSSTPLFFFTKGFSFSQLMKRRPESPDPFFFLLLSSGEPGEFVGRIQKNHPLRDFDGYADESATKKKILRDVFKKGDLCFRSG